MQPILPSAPLFVPIEKGYFTDEGIMVEWDPAAATNNPAPLVAAGQIDVSQSSMTVSLLNALDRDLDVRVISGLTGYPPQPPPSEGVVVRKELFDRGDVTEWSGLRGRKVALRSAGSVSQYVLGQGLKAAGMTIMDIDETYLDFPDMGPAMENGSIDAAYMVEPFATQSVDEGWGVIMQLPESVNETQISMLIASPSFVERAEVAEGFMRGVLRGLGDLAEGGWDAPDNATIIEQYTKVPAEVLSHMLRQYGDPRGEISWGSLEAQQRFFIETEQTTYPGPLDLKKFYDGTAREAALQSLGI